MIEQLIQRLSIEAFARRAERLRRYLGETERAANLQRLRALIHDLTRAGEPAQTVSFEEFRQRIERPRFGVVFTAHPTFALAHAVQQALVELALGVTAAGEPLDRRPPRGPARAGSLRASTAPISRSTSTRSIANPCTPSTICTARWIGCAASCSTSRERSIRSAGPS